MMLDWIRERVGKPWVGHYDWDRPSKASVRHADGKSTVRFVGPHLRAMLETDWSSDWVARGLRPPSEGPWWIWEGKVELRGEELWAVGSWALATGSELAVIVGGDLPWDGSDWMTAEGVEAEAREAYERGLAELAAEEADDWRYADD